MKDEIDFGLTGGIACGKSTVTKTFRKYDIPLVDADIVARQVVELGTYGLYQLTNCFGKEYLLEDDTLNRRKLGNLVFFDKNAMQKLNTIMKPLIETESKRQIEELHRNGYNIVGYDAALICEFGYADQYRPLIVVSCRPEQQLERMMSRDEFTEQEALARINAQMPVIEKVKYADYVIDTSKTLEDNKEQSEAIVKKFINVS